MESLRKEPGLYFFPEGKGGSGLDVLLQEDRSCVAVRFLDPCPAEDLIPSSGLPSLP